MQTFPMPKKLNGEQLINELKNANIDIIGLPEDWADGLLRLDINENDVEKTKVIVNNHVGLDREITINDKLLSVGLTIDDLKAALGL